MQKEKKKSIQITNSTLKSTRISWDAVPGASRCFTSSPVCFLSHDRIISATRSTKAAAFLSSRTFPFVFLLPFYSLMPSLFLLSVLF